MLAKLYFDNIGYLLLTNYKIKYIFIEMETI
jgi:hypothetical protein